ncbi:TIGR03915 family putative DNA repair protein [Siphonobacter curvatus]|uniref:DNA metabolism protein n=1 Tax=Siphonobacter curvatus TaxID=2094562 RepID=A0A2S7IN87_9BACT|nr:TIGR03915 family putative DNA repair protein [Siphonobacter curvatus]PQA59192.1 DNA metabolism protein [Siphonobacter curvatus]
MEIYVFDDTFEGFLTLIFDWYNRKPGSITVSSAKHYHPQAFSQTYFIVTDPEKAMRVATGLRKRLSKEAWRAVYCTFLSERLEAYEHLFGFAVYVFSDVSQAESNYGNEHVLFVHQMARKVEREKHHLEAFVRFQQTQDGMYYAPIEPKYNVLPLIAGHFRGRYADQSWVIYDHVRKYGLYYDLQRLQLITLDFQRSHNFDTPARISEDHHEEMYQLLWKDYFKSANIPARRNLKLHVRNLPRRFWKYLTEKQVLD